MKEQFTKILQIALIIFATAGYMYMLYWTFAYPGPESSPVQMIWP